MPLTSPYPDVEIPDVALTEFILASAGERPDKPAIVDGPSGRTVTFGELGDRIQRFAGGLQARGFQKGDVLAILLPNVPEYAIAFHGAAYAGGTVTTVNPLYNAEEVGFQLKDAGAKFAVTIPQAKGAISGVEATFVVGEESFADLLQSEPLAERVAIDPAEDVVALPYSSGTTGRPKGVMLTHRNLVANLLQAFNSLGMSEDDRVIGVLPFFHIYGMTVIMNLSAWRGATVVTMPRFDLEQFLTLIQEHEITRAYVVPPIALALAKHPAVDQFDTSSLELVLSGAAPLGAELERACEERLGCLVRQGYGLTETSPVTHTVPLGADKAKPGSIGPALPNTECRIVGEDGDDVPAGERGELWIRGPQVMKGYLNNAEATRATVDDEGWLHTGDVAIVDEDGYFAIVDRVKELIKVKGFQVAPAELEALLLEHPAVGDAAVIPIPDEEAGELPKAFVKLQGEASEDDIKQFVADRVSSYKRIKHLEVVEEIPKSASGKILRRLLVDQEREKAGSQQS